MSEKESVMDLTESDRIQLKRFVQRVTERPAPIEVQPNRREGVFLWCEDWELIELGKCLFMGNDVYLNDPPPRRLRYNPLWSQADIVAKAEALRQKYAGNAGEIINDLESRRVVYV